LTLHGSNIEFQKLKPNYNRAYTNLETSTMTTLITKDNVAFHVSGAGIELMKTMSNIIELYGESEEPIPVSNIDSATFKHVLEYAEKYLANPFEFKDDTIVDSPDGFAIQPRPRTFQPWEEEFFNTPWSKVKDVMMAANFLEFDILLQACAQYIASQIVKKTPEEIKEYCST
jgi:hypothetical protein